MNIEIPTKQVFDQQVAASRVRQAREVTGIKRYVLAKKIGISDELLGHRERSGVGLNPANFQQHIAAIEALKGE